MTGFLCGGGPSGRCMMQCPICGGKKRAVVTYVYSGYAVDQVCCGCGSLWTDCERLPGNNGKSECAARRDEARKAWPTLHSAREVMKVLFDAANEGREWWESQTGSSL